jgi:ribosomal protein S6--L-glutamate ligase
MNNIEKYIIVGSEEWCGLPELGIPAIQVRIDSGAKTSAIHASNLQKFMRDDELWVAYEVYPLRDNKRVIVQCESKVVDTRMIKNTSGLSEKRFVIKTPLVLDEQTWEIEVTLANRDSMGFKMLLGREAMKSRILVNPESGSRLGNYSKKEIEQFYGDLKEPRKGLKIALLASNPELYSNKRIMEAGEERGHEMIFLNAEHCYMKLDANEPEVRYRGGSILNDLDAVIPRIKPNMTFYGCALLRQFESKGIFCMNDASSISQSRDKLFASQILSKNGIQIPITGFAKSPLDTKDLIHMVNDAPLVIKLLESTQGKGVVLAETKKAAESVINAFKSLQTNILVQEFIKESDGKDIRCFVVDGKVVATMQRQASKGEFRANIHQGGTASVIKITPEEKKMALKAAKTFNLFVAGVDIIRSNKGPLMLEVNSSPGLEGIEGVTGKDIAGSMIAAVERKVGFSRK